MKESSLERLQYDSIYGIYDIYDIWKNCRKSKKISGSQGFLKERDRDKQVKRRGYGGSETLSMILWW